MKVCVSDRVLRAASSAQQHGLEEIGFVDVVSDLVGGGPSSLHHLINEPHSLIGCLKRICIRTNSICQGKNYLLLRFGREIAPIYAYSIESRGPTQPCNVPIKLSFFSALSPASI